MTAFTWNKRSILPRAAWNKGTKEQRNKGTKERQSSPSALDRPTADRGGRRVHGRRTAAAERVSDRPSAYMSDGEVIVPPPNVRGLLEKAAGAVGKTPALESKIIEKHATDPRFAFLRPSDPYHAYYQAKVIAARALLSKPRAADPVAGEEAGPKDPSQPDVKAEQAPPTAPLQEVAPAVSKLKAARIKADGERPAPEQPPAGDLFSVPDAVPTPDHLSLDVIKLVAHFCARDGREFVSLLSAKEDRNPLFDFLKPMHPHFPVFQRMTDAYAAILDGRTTGSDLAVALQDCASSREGVLRKFWYRHDWERAQSSKAGDAPVPAAAFEALAAVDWHDFIVLETIDFGDDEKNLPAPLADPTQIPRVMAAADAARLEWEKNREEVDMDMDMDVDVDEGQAHAAANGHASAVIETADVDADIPSDRVRRRGMGDEPRSYRDGGAGERYPSATPSGTSAAPRREDVRLPDGQVVPMSEATPAMHAQLMDPKYKEERMRAAEKNQRQNLADGEQVALQLARLKQSKPDTGVYNRGDLQGSLAGRGRARDAVVEPVALPEPTASGPHLPSGSRPPGGADDAAQPARRARIEAAVDALTHAATAKPALGKQDPTTAADGAELQAVLPAAETPDGLVPEAEWLSKAGDKVAVCVKVPVHASQDWKLSGQEINLEVPLRSTVQRLKEVLAKPACTKVPANKQKLHYEGAGFLSNRHTLAYYNVAAGGTITLEVKERGGKKKAP
jgi:splicing factor 3A subunit 1